MAITKINSSDTTSNKIDTLSDYTIELDGKISSGKFDSNEIDELYAGLDISRKYLRNQSLGHTLATYSGWTHLQTETGYSIWKYTPTSYTYNILNQLYFDNKLVTNAGQASSETATSFTYVYFYNGDSGSGYTDYSSESGIESGTEFSINNSTNDYLYIGHSSSTFNGAKFEFQTKGSNYTLKVEYFDGTSGINTWVALSTTTDSLVDNTSNFESDGTITWVAPASWETTTINSATAFWIRISTTTIPVTTAKVYLLIPGTSVIGLLGLSSTEIANESWKWCSYGTAIYVTIRNDGVSTYEGDYFLRSSSSTTNKQNFFIYNHGYTADYQTSAHDYVVTKTSSYDCLGTEGIILSDASSNPVTVTLPTALGREGKKITIKAISVAYSNIVDCISGETIDGAGVYTFTSNYKFITVVSNGTLWYIISN